MKVLKKALRTCKIKKLKYITDGGKKNDNWTVKEFLQKHYASINHYIALRDIIQSNSMVESVFRTMKSNYLYLRKTNNLKQLMQVMKDFVFEYNEIKPHFSQSYYTPSEIYSGENNSVDVKKISKKAMSDRMNSNLSCSCIECIGCKSKNEN